MDRNNMIQALKEAGDMVNEVQMQIDITANAAKAIEWRVNCGFPDSRDDWCETGCLLICLTRQLDYLYDLVDKAVHSLGDAERKLSSLGEKES